MKLVTQIRSFITFFFLLLLTACGDSSDSPFPAPACGSADNPCKELVTFTITPNQQTVLVGISQQFTATAYYDDGSQDDVTEQVTWQSSDESIASISNDNNSKGLATGNSAGTVTVSAALFDFTAAAKLVVMNEPIEELLIIPHDKTMPIGTEQQFAALLLLTNKQTVDVTTQVTWQVDDQNIASLSDISTITAKSQGETQVNASFSHESNELTASANISVIESTVSEIVINPANGKFPLGSTGYFTALAYFTDGHVEDISKQATWSIDDSNIVTIIETGEQAGYATADEVGTTQVSAEFNDLTGFTQVEVTPAILVHIEVNPVDKVTPAGTSVAYQAYAFYSDDSRYDITELAAWSSSVPEVANIQFTGALSGIAYTFTPGVTEITAHYLEQTATETLTVTAAVAESLQITPANPSVPLGSQGQFTAIAYYSDKTTADVTQIANWHSSNSDVAVITPQGIDGGFTSTVDLGVSNISVEFDNLSAQTELTVTQATLTSLSLTPANSTVAAGTQQAYQLYGLYSDGSSKELNSYASWQSSETNLATVNSTGIASTYKPGSVTISASYQGMTTQATLNISQAELTRISVTPNQYSLPVGHQSHLTAKAHYSDNSIQNITSIASWKSTDTSLVKVLNGTNGGLIDALAIGSTSVTASYQGMTASSTITVTDAVLESVSISPIKASIAAGLTQQYTLTARYSDNSTKNVTSQSSWQSTSLATATIDSLGLATGQQQGNTIISGSYKSHTASAELTVTSAVTTGLQIAPSTPSNPLGSQGQFIATAFYSNGHSADVTSNATWSSTEPSKVSIISSGNMAGYASADNLGSSTIQANFDSQVASTLATVTDAVLTKIVISPAIADIALGTNFQYAATGIYSDASTRDISLLAHWSSADTTVASIDLTGVAHGNTEGSTSITAHYQGFDASATLNVGPAILDHIEVTPSLMTLPAGTSANFTATAIDSAGKRYDIANFANWQVVDSSIAHVDNSNINGGLVTGLVQGNTDIQVHFSGMQETVQVEVTAAVIDLLVISPLAPTITLGESQTFTATAHFSDASSQDVTHSASWQSSDSSVASVANEGLFVSASNGITNVTASYQGENAATTLTVEGKVIDHLQITPLVKYLPEGDSHQFKCNIIYTDSSIGNCTTQATWDSEDTSIAHVEPSGNTAGFVSALSEGNTFIHARYMGFNTKAQVSVTKPELTSISVTPSNQLLGKGQPQSYQATGHYDNGDTIDLSSEVVWSVADNAIAEINTHGRLFGTNVGETQVIADYQGLQGKTKVTISEHVFYTGDIDPDPINLRVGDEIQLKCYGTYVLPPNAADPRTVEITEEVSWGLEFSTQVATIDNTPGNKGYLTAIKAGTNRVACKLPQSNGSFISITAPITVTD